MTVAEARQRLGLTECDQFTEALPHWKEVETRLIGLVANTADPIARAGLKKDLKSLREVLQILENQPRESKSKKGFVLLLLFVALLWHDFKLNDGASWHQPHRAKGPSRARAGCRGR